MLALLLTTFSGARGQETIPSITQARLFANPSAPGTTSSDANGIALPEDNATSSGDDSFGTQIILKVKSGHAVSTFSGTSPRFTRTMSILRRTERGVTFFSPPMLERRGVRRSRPGSSRNYRHRVLFFATTEPVSWI